MMRVAQPSSRDELREQIRTQVEDAVRAAQKGATYQGARGGRHVVVMPDGRKLIIDGSTVRYEGEPPLTAAGTRSRRDTPNVPDGVVDIVQAVGTTVVLCVVGFPLARAFARSLDRRGTAPKVPPEVLSRLNSIEQAVDTVAVEIERISEGQRFTTKLLNDRVTRELADPVPAGEHARG